MGQARPRTFDEATIRKAAKVLLEAAPGSTVILFGSYARGEPTADSDLDFLVVEAHVASVLDEMVRLRDALRCLRVRADVLVIDEESFKRRRRTPGNVCYRASKEGRLFDAVA